MGKIMNNTDLLQIPLAVHESDMEREDRKHKRMFILIIVLITYSFLVTAVMIASNYWWIEYEKSFQDEVTTTITQEGEADGNGTVLLNNGGDLNYGYESEADGNDN